MSASLRYVALISSVLSIAPATKAGDAIDDFVQAEMKRRQIPGVAFAIVEDGRTVRVGAYGFANLEHDALVRPDSVFELASTTKQFTAAAVMLLVEDGEVALSDKITKYVPSAPDAWADITVEHLLTHTAGLPPFFPFQDDRMNPTELTTGQMLDSLRSARMVAPVGARAIYSDPGYFLLGMVIEKASSMRYEAFLKERIFDPLGMDNSSVLDQWRIIKHRVAPYTLRDGRLLRGRRDWQQELPSHYGVFSSAEDVARWVGALQRGSMLSESSRTRMWTPAKLADGSEAMVWGANYGYGWMVGDYRGHRLVEHGGFSGTHILSFRDRPLAVVVLTNLDVRSGSEPHILARGIAGQYDKTLALPHTLEPAVMNDSELAKQLEGIIRATATGETAGGTTKAFGKYLRRLPPFIRDDVAERLDGFEAIRLIAEQDVSDRSLTRFGQPVDRLVFANLATRNGQWCYTFWLTGKNEVTDMRSYRNQ